MKKLIAKVFLISVLCLASMPASAGNSDWFGCWHWMDANGNTGLTCYFFWGSVTVGQRR